MNSFRPTWVSILTGLILLCSCSEGGLDTPSSGARPEPLPNLFSQWLGVSQEAVDAKLATAWRHFFEGDSETERVYYEVPEDMAYIWDVGSNDVRSEGMSYGMMIAVQMDQQEAFNRLWKWAVTHMRHESGPLEGYFAWHCDLEGNRLSEGPAPDGEEWFAMALYFASGRWGDGEGIFNYRKEADAILYAMPRRDPHDHYIPMFDREEAMIRFVPNRDWTRVTDPSYHLPAFYELWARWAATDRELWQRAAEVSRAYFKEVAHPQTGLMPDYATFEGEAYVWNGHEDFRFDAHRTLQNVALDWAWWRDDPWAQEWCNRVLGFFETFEDYVPNQMALDGTPLSDSGSTSLESMAAVAAFAADRELAEPWVRNLWEMEPPTGQWRYYNGMLYFLALLQVSGEFKAYAPEGLE